MKSVLVSLAFTAIIISSVNCRSTKKLQVAVAKKDTSVIVQPAKSAEDSTTEKAAVLDHLTKNHIVFETFSAKIKVDYSDSHGNQPDVNAFVRMKKDSIIWISINATFLNIEAFRILIKKDSMWILNKLEKKVETHPLSYLEEVAKIPLDLSTLQELIIGNPLFLGKTIVSVRKTENRVLLSTIDEHFKNLFTLTSGDYLLERSKLDDLDVSQNRTADLSYTNYENNAGVNFATSREIIVAEKTRVDIQLNFKQYDFNKDLLYPFTIPKNYKTK